MTGEKAPNLLRKLKQKEDEMKAEITELWESGRKILTSDSEECIETLSELQGCENVILGEMLAQGHFEILLDDAILFTTFRVVTHPADGGKMIICEID